MAQRVLSCSVDAEQETLTFTVIDRPDIAPVVFSAAGLPAAVRTHAMLHGFEQRLRDSVAGTLAELGVDGYAEYFAGKVADLAATFRAGQWSVSGDREPGSGKGASMLVLAVSRIRGTSIREASEWLRSLPEATRKAMPDVPRVIDEIARIKAERSAGRSAVADAESALVG